MKKLLIASALLAALPLAAHAADGEWKGTGELGFAASRGNAKSENLNAKLNFSMEDDTWKDNFYATALRSKGNVKQTTVVNGQIVNLTEYQAPANRYELGASAGYKFDERSYLVGAVRYENDDFSPFDYQAVLSLGYGYTAIKNSRTELSFEVGPGYKRYKPLNGSSDGDALGWWWGETLRQHMFRPPSVFNFYPPDYPVPGKPGMVGPQFGIHNANAALERLNFLTYLLYWGGSDPAAGVPGAFGTRIDTTPFEADAADAAKLVDRLSVLATGAALPTGTRGRIVSAVEAFASSNSANWQSERARQAAYLVFATPAFQVQR